MAEKVKAHELIDVQNVVSEAIKEVAPNRTVDLTEHQMKRIEKKVHENIVNRFIKQVETELVAGNSVEFPHQFNVYPHASTVRVNEKGEPKRKISVKTRKALNNKLND